MISIPSAAASPAPRLDRPRLRAERPRTERNPGESTLPSSDAVAVYFLHRRSLKDDQPTGFEAICLRQAARQPPMGLLMQYVLQHPGLMPHEVLSVSLPEELTRSDRLIGAVGSALATMGFPGHRLELILPETMLVDLDADGLLALSALRDLGVGLCVDAFGAGVTSLTLLRRLPLTSIKLARTLVRGLPIDREDAAIAKAAIATAQTMGLSVVADGVETEQQRAFLAHCGCDEGQGPLFGAPLRFPPQHRMAFTA